MKRLHFQRPRNLNLLHDELLAAVLAVRPIVNASGQQEAVLRVEGLGDDIWLTVPDTADDAAIAAVVAAHDPTRPTQEEVARQQREADIQARAEDVVAVLPGAATLTPEQRAEAVRRVLALGRAMGRAV